MTIGLEFTGDYDAVQRNFDKLAQLAVDGGDRSASIRFGTDTVTFAGATPNGTQTVSHGLGRVPVAIFVCPSGAVNVIGAVQGGTVTASVFVAILSEKNGTNLAAATTRNFYWLAIG